MSYASMGANIAGTELQGWASLLDKWAMQDAFKAEAQRQTGYANQAMDVFNKRLQYAGADYANKFLARDTASREKGYGDLNKTPLSVNTTPYSGGRGGADTAYINMRGAQRAKLGAYGDYLGRQKIQTGETARELNPIINFAKGTAGVFPYRMYEAQHSMDDMAAIGAALSSLGGGSGGNIGQSLSSSPPGGYGQGTYYPYGGAYGASLGGYSNMPGFQDAYGNYYPAGWNNYSGPAIAG